MTFKKFGYYNETIQVRQMTVGEMALTIAKSFIEHNSRNLEIRLVDVDMGRIDSFAGLDDFLVKIADWNVGMMIKIFDYGTMWDSRTESGFLKVVIGNVPNNVLDEAETK